MINIQRAILLLTSAKVYPHFIHTWVTIPSIVAFVTEVGCTEAMPICYGTAESAFEHNRIISMLFTVGLASRS